MIYYNGFSYEITQPSRNQTVYEVEIYDSAGTSVHREIRSNWSYASAEAYARNWIDIASGNTPGDIGDIEYDDLQPDVPDVDEIEYPHFMYDCETRQRYTANNFEEHQELDALGYVHSLLECEVEVNQDEVLEVEAAVPLVIKSLLVPLAT